MKSIKQVAFVLGLKLDPVVLVVMFDEVVLLFMILDVFVKLAIPMMMDVVLKQTLMAFSLEV